MQVKVYSSKYIYPQDMVMLQIWQRCFVTKIKSMAYFTDAGSQHVYKNEQYLKLNYSESVSYSKALLQH